MSNQKITLSFTNAKLDRRGTTSVILKGLLTAENATEYEIRNFSVKVYWYDGDVLLGSTYDSTPALPPNKKCAWHTLATFFDTRETSKAPISIQRYNTKKAYTHYTTEHSCKFFDSNGAEVAAKIPIEYGHWENPTLKSNCFVVTACCGDEFHPLVGQFRSFRDDRLLHSVLGCSFVRVYMIVGPHIAKIITGKPKLRDFLYKILARLAKIIC